MFDNWYDVMENAKMKNESIFNDVQNIRMRNELHKKKGSSKIGIYILGNLGKAFSSVGHSLQEHYHLESESKVMKKVS